MRSTRFQIAALAILSLAAISCSSQRDAESTTAAQRSIAHLSLVPTFSPAAVQAYGALTRAGLDVVSVHVVLRRLDGLVLYEGDVAFPPNVNELSVEVPVEISGREEELSATIELRDANGVVQFAATQNVIARNATLPAIVSRAVVVQYVGPGFDIRTLSVSPADAQVQPGTSQNLAVTGLDVAGNSVASVAVVWTSSDTSVARVSATSASTAVVTARAARGTAIITATSPSGLTATARLTFLPQASRLVVVSGDRQTGVSNSYLPSQLVIEVQGTDGKPVSGRAVSFRPLTAEANVGVSDGVSDADGRARTTLKLGRAVGAHSYEVTSGSLPPLTVSATATAAPIGPPTQIIPLSAFPSQFTVGTAPVTNFMAQLADANGVYVRQAGVSLTILVVYSPSNTTASATAASDANGVFTLSLPVYNGTPGTATVTMSSPTLTNLPSGTFTVK